MKVRNTLLAAVAVSTLGLLPAALHAQTSVTTTTSPVVTGTTTMITSSNLEGTVTSFTPASSQIVVRSSAGSPVTYSYSKTTTFVDADGNTVSSETIQPGTPTTVYYATENGQSVVSKVVVRRPAPATVVVPATTTRTETTETTTTTHKK